MCESYFQGYHEGLRQVRGPEGHSSVKTCRSKCPCGQLGGKPIIVRAIAECPRTAQLIRELLGSPSKWRWTAICEENPKPSNAEACPEKKPSWLENSLTIVLYCKQPAHSLEGHLRLALPY